MHPGVDARLDLAGAAPVDAAVAHALLSGKVEPAEGTPAQSRRARRLRLIAGVAGAGAITLLAVSLGTDSASRLGAFFGAGTLSLTASLIFFRATLLAPRRGGDAVSSVAWLGIRNGGRNPTRSVLCAALVACAAFMIVTVAMNRQDVSAREPSFDSGDGGFRLFAEADAPLFRSGIDGIETEQDGAMTIMPLRVRAGEDASCLNLYQPTQPTLASVPPGLITRGGFAFQKTLAETEAEHANPWLLLEKDFGGRIPVFGDANSVTWILHLGLGQELVVEDAKGGERRLVLAGLLSRSIFQSELVMAERHFLDLYSDHTGYQALLVETEAADAAATLENTFAEEGLDATRTSERLAEFLVVENTYLSTFLTLGGLGLLLGTLGLAVVMVRSVLERRGELALLEALGFARGSISGLVFAENSFLLVFGVGIGTASALLAVAPHLASSAADPPWASLLLMLGVIVQWDCSREAPRWRCRCARPCLQACVGTDLEGRQRYRVRANSTALSRARALFIVSSHSRSGTESATIPAPTWRYPFSPLTIIVRIAIAEVSEPEKSRYMTLPE